MDCERCEELLVDYVSGELSEGEAAELRAALDGCEHCRHALEKLERGKALARAMPRLDPPPAILAAVMRAAEARALELRAADEAVRASAPEPARPRAVREEEDAGLGAIWKWLASLLHGPQFAMAALLLLMVGVGLWWVPALSGPRAISPPLVSETPPAVARSESLSPAEVPHLEIDPRTGRVGIDEEEGERAGAAEGRERVLAEAETGRPRLVETPEPEPSDEAETLAAVAALELGTGESALGRTESGALPPIAPSTGPASVAPSPAPSPSLDPSPGSAERSARTSLGGEGRGPTSPDEVPAPGLDDSTIPASLHHQARELASAGSLSEAARAYERLLATHADYAAAPRAMMELAEVYRRLGALTSARRWLTRAARSPSVSADANRELARLDSMERAAAMDMDSADTTGAETEAAEAAPPSGSGAYE